MKKPKIKKPDLKKVKEKFDSISLKKSRYDKFDDMEDFDNNDISFSEKSGLKKSNLLSKTKALLSDFKTLEDENDDIILTSFDEEEYLLSEDDLSDLQSELAMMSADIKHESEKKAKWESVPTFKSFVKEERESKIDFEEDYWVVEFASLFALLLKSRELDEIINCLRFPYSLKQPILARLFRKLKTMDKVFLLI